MTGGLLIREARIGDSDAMWDIFRQVIASGDAFPFGESFDRQTFVAHWHGGHQAYVATQGQSIVGMYKMGANYPDHGSHVASATYAVAPQAQGQGVGRAMVADSLERACRDGFLAMQFNYVVTTNAPAMALYRKFGFEQVGTLPKAFRHRQLGLVDACVLFREL
ncbi:MAG TPA: N-acetyltransferase [Pseudoduganella sp.]